MKKEMKYAIAATIIGIVLVTGFIVYTILSKKTPKVEGQEAAINISEEFVEDVIPDPVLLEGDAVLEKERGKTTSYVDDDNILTPREMMSLRNHIIFTEALTTFLNDSRYPSERIIVTSEGAGYEGNISHFYASVDGYEDVTLYVESYNNIDAFNFTLYKGSEIVASSKEQYKKNTEAYEKELEDNFNEAASTLGTTYELEGDDD